LIADAEEAPFVFEVVVVVHKGTEIELVGPIDCAHSWDFCRSLSLGSSKKKGLFSRLSRSCFQSHPVNRS